MPEYRRRRRRVDYSAYASTPLIEAAERYERLYEVIKLLEWLLERQPDNRFASQVGDGHWLIKSEDGPPMFGPGIPGVTMIYTFDDEVVTIWGARVEPPPQIDYA